ncbi:carbon monoxide dehydrogenase [Polynucleobacter sp. SHI8]|uniref:xanthine dehydrogenase family protein molybdopterin-binding subunit n=1 Tax=unclassified Polynucleobacter TaxID=2640945 RepID=UPI002491D479|nr:MULTISPECIES: xanthine dehydrogenase family protein molybdopterin-binding subunit [unclassified Polynucleobacter]BDW11798.1 carbon monoxide dehydrogenase [Polynucleobacter sp. SHI2]BDW14245.1 carbon monoxide dehydrogenase [Polynucleobacter sp. SHI8]
MNAPQDLLRKEDLRLITGHGKFTADWSYDGMCYGYVIRSPYAHGLIKSINYQEVLSAPGVIRVITAEDIAAAGMKTLPTGATMQNLDGQNQILAPMPVLAIDRVRFVGQPIAMVIADTYENAKHAAELVQMDIEALEAVTDYDSARAVGAPQLHAQANGNLSIHYIRGDQAATEKAFEQATFVSSMGVKSQRLIGSPMELRAVLAKYDASSDTYIMHSPNQGMLGMLGALEHVTGIPKAQIDLQTQDVGGSFGVRSGAFSESALVMLGSKLIGKPVKWMGTRSEIFLSDWHGRGLELNGFIALDSHGKILGLRFENTADLGAYTCYFGSFIGARNVSITMNGVYDIPALSMSSELYFTNTVPVSAYRGAGRPDIAYAIERLIDHAAYEHGFDPIELRRKNFIQPNQFPYDNHIGSVYDCGEFDRLLNRALEMSDYKNFEQRRQKSLKNNKLRGIGLAYFLEASGAGTAPKDQVIGQFTEDGKLRIFAVTGASGQGHETSFSQIVHEKIGLANDHVEFVAGQSDKMMIGSGTGGSRTLYGAGSAVMNLCEQILEKSKPLAAQVLNTEESQLEFSHGVWKHTGSNQSCTISQLVQKTFTQGQPHPLNLTGEASSGATYPNGCHIAEVEIDPDTGVTEIIQYTAVDDVGVAISPVLVQGQIHGGIVQGIGQAFYEQAIYDASGQLLTGSFMDYAMPKVGCLMNIQTEKIEVPTKNNILGSKGVGESGCSGSLPTLSNAVINALRPRGITEMDMPYTPAKIWQALQNQ